MKRCPECRRDYYDDSMLYCLDDGSALLEGPALGSEPATALVHDTDAVDDRPTRAHIHTTDKTTVLPTDLRATAKRFDRRILLAPLLIAGIVLGGFIGYRNFAPTKDQLDSVAVLPFQNSSGNADSEYLSDGLAESLIYRLSQLPDLKVSPASAVMRYKGKDISVRDIAAELGVKAVMTGRMIQRGENLNISVELIDAANNKILWGEQYERKMSELLATQREIATTIAEKLQLKLSFTEGTGITKKYTDSNDAYQLYLKGRYQWNKRTADSLKAAEGFYKASIEKDPTFALAFSGLAETYALYPNYSVASPRDSQPQTKAAAQKAIELDPTLAEPHAALGIYHLNYTWNLDAAISELRRAAELNPKYATAFHWLGNVLPAVGKCDEAIPAAKRAEELDPLSLIISADIGYDLIVCRRYDEAIAQAQRTLQLDPNFYYAHYIAGWAYTEKGMHKEAIAALRRSRELNVDPFATALLIRALARAGERAEAMQLRDGLKKEAAARYIPSFIIAVADASLGEKDSAFAALEREFLERGTFMPALIVDPSIDDLRGDPRFDAMVKRVRSSQLE